MGSDLHINTSGKKQELSRYLLELIIVRAIVLLLGLNLADRLGILQERLGSFPFLAVFQYPRANIDAGFPDAVDVGQAPAFSAISPDRG
jgi:hypothetical protein